MDIEKVSRDEIYKVVTEMLLEKDARDALKKGGGQMPSKALGHVSILHRAHFDLLDRVGRKLTPDYSDDFKELYSLASALLADYTDLLSKYESLLNRSDDLTLELLKTQIRSSVQSFRVGF